MRIWPWLALGALLTGCEGDSLLAGERLDELFGVNPLPGQPAWAIAWLDGVDDEVGLVIDCGLRPAVILDESEVSFGEVLVEPPEDLRPDFAVQTGGPLQWTAGFPILVDAERFETPSASLGDVRFDDPLSFDKGVWGIPSSAWLSVEVLLDEEGDVDEGELEDVLFELGDFLLLDAEAELEPGGGWWDVLVETAALSREFRNTLVYSDLNDDESPLFVLSTEFVGDSHYQVWSGQTLQGLFGGCR